MEAPKTENLILYVHQSIERTSQVSRRVKKKVLIYTYTKKKYILLEYPNPEKNTILCLELVLFSTTTDHP